MRLILKRVLNEIPGIELIGEAENGRQLIKMTEDLKPDVIFLDVDMPEINGVEAAREIFDINPKIFFIFATAYDCYTHEAFEVYAFDYMMKPFNLDRIRQTVKRLRDLNTNKEQNCRIERPANPKGKGNPKLKIQSNDKYYFIDIHDIILITRENRRTIIYIGNGEVIPTYESLQELEERLKDYDFFRCHKGFIINPEMVTEILPWGSKTYSIKLANTTLTALMTLEKVKEFQERYYII